MLERKRRGRRPKDPKRGLNFPFGKQSFHERRKFTEGRAKGAQTGNRKKKTLKKPLLRSFWETLCAHPEKKRGWLTEKGREKGEKIEKVRRQGEEKGERALLFCHHVQETYIDDLMQ